MKVSLVLPMKKGFRVEEIHKNTRVDLSIIDIVFIIINSY